MKATAPHEQPSRDTHALRAPPDAEILKVCRRIVKSQAEDEVLWSPRTFVESYCVQELRTLHRAVEGDLTVMAAIEDP